MTVIVYGVAPGAASRFWRCIPSLDKLRINDLHFVRGSKGVRVRLLLLVLLVMVVETVVEQRAGLASCPDSGILLTAAHQDFGPAEDEDLAEEFDPRVAAFLLAFAGSPLAPITGRLHSRVVPRVHRPEIVAPRDRGPPAPKRVVAS